jgi:uncharacterized membrane protein YkgB
MRGTSTVMRCTTVSFLRSGLSIRRLDTAVTRWMAHHGVTFLRISLGIVYLWFGGLKLMPHLSPAEDLAARTIEALTFGVMPPFVSRPVLATWECLIGLGLLSGLRMRAVLLLLFVHMAGTITPLYFFPTEVFQRFPNVPTLEGQYIIKNLVLFSAAIVIGATVRGGQLVADPETERPGPGSESVDLSVVVASHEEPGPRSAFRGAV